MREIDARRSGRPGDGEPGEEQEPKPKRRLDAALPNAEPMLVTWLERVTELVREEPRLLITPECVRPVGGGEAQEPPLAVGTFPQTEPPPLLVDGPVRELRLADEPGRTDPQVTPVSADDLSDWLRQTVRVLRGAGSLRIDAARLARLMGEGDEALRALGCSVEHGADGRAYVVYPRRSR
jgi:hypothetical protein